MRLRLSYTGDVPEEFYEFDEGTFERLARAGVSPQAVIQVLYGDRPVVRRHIGAALQIAGQDNTGNWLAVSLIEGRDDRYVVTGGRYLDEDEIAVVSRYVSREGQ
jgi:hypothetical protein